MVFIIMLERAGGWRADKVVAVELGMSGRLWIFGEGSTRVRINDNR